MKVILFSAVAILHRQIHSFDSQKRLKHNSQFFANEKSEKE
jgi:hypothetical protein